MDSRTKQRLDRQLDAWRDELISLDRRNRALYFKHTKTSSLEVVEPGSDEIAADLSRGWCFHVPEPPPEDESEELLASRPAPQRSTNEVLVGDKSRTELLAGLRRLERLAEQEFVDKGLWTLYLGLDVLRWRDPDAVGNAAQWVESPLLLVPVTFGRTTRQEQFRLELTDDDPVINPVLAAKLAGDFGIELPSVEDETAIDPAGVRRAVALAIGSREGWEVVQRAVLTTFTFHKEAMYRDLKDHAEQIGEHPAVQLLALGPDAPNAADFDFAVTADEELDTVVPPEELLSILDADSTQRKAILAARDGHSFVIDGPPGTGKSQTISNIIAELMARGRSVLFVSEKAAALEVVYKRLASAQLDDFLLQLHSHQATRKAVASELGRVLVGRPRARSTNDSALRGKLASARRSLSGYALAMNEVRQPLNRSLHDVLGQIAALHDSPHAPLPHAIGKHLSVDDLNAIVGHAEILGRNWAPVARGDDFLWREIRDTRASVGHQYELAQLVNAAVAAQQRLRSMVEPIADELRIRWNFSIGDVERLHELLRLCDDRPVVPVAWLTADSLTVASDRIRDRRQCVDAYLNLVSRLHAELGDEWRQLDPTIGPHVHEAFDSCSFDLPPYDCGTMYSLTDLTHSVERLQAAAQRTETIEADGTVMAQAFGARWSELSVSRIGRLSELSQMAGAADRPESEWLNPANRESVKRATSVLGALVADFRSRRESLASTFAPSVLELDLIGLHERFTRHHRGFGKLSRQYREDKRVLSGATITGKVTKETVSRLAEAVAWAELDKRLAGAEREFAGHLGSYYDRERADFGRIVQTVETAEQALRLAGDELEHDHLVKQLSSAGTPDGAVVAAGARSAEQLAAWTTDLNDVLGESGVAALSAMSTHEAAEYLERQAARLELLIEAKRVVDRLASQPMTVRGVVEMTVAAAEAARLREELRDAEPGDVALLGSNYSGIDTDWEALASSLHWTENVRALLGGPVRSNTADALLTTTYRSAEVTATLQEHQKRQEELLLRFEEGWARRLRDDLRVSFDEAAALLDQMSATTSDIEIWSLYNRSLAQLNDLGLEPVMAFAVDKRVPAEQVARLVSRAVLEAWADDIVASDNDRLSPLQAHERESLVDQFHNLDRALVAGAAADVVNVCAARRPSSLAGAAAVIAREAQKKRRHMSIRQLLGKAGGVAQQLKPCFMMSPLSVSQYLPADLEFDTVIFDEASQVRPSDAINCVYRGKQLIVAGDERQLPPSSFFQVMGADEEDVYDEEAPEDFESVLGLSKASGTVRSLPLLWHYRSQHEDLISYSNYRFYDGHLFTFPSAAQRADDLGIEVFKVNGVYRRGSSRDNPIEAAKVVERVLFHVHQHPNLTLGVVTFSAAQEDAIEAELERQSIIHPELQGLMGDDRLRGFFIKNLENVQGDERDLIIFSVGYGRDENGKFTLNLGPLNRKGGWRRLNVAITRARRRVEIVTSVLPGDFGVEPTTEGIRHLRSYLDFGLRGRAALAIDLGESEGDAESPFEEEVIRVIRSWGYEAVPQVGLAGYRIDIAVRDPRDSSRFLLAVECDGAMYHSAKAARDRDRLRQQVIEGLGWQVHRIWSTSWFRDRDGQEHRLRQAIEDAERGERSELPQELPTPIEVAHDAIDFDAPPPWTTPYRTAELWTPSTYGEMHEVEARPDITRMVRAVVNVESPVHAERVLAAVREAFGLGRAGSRIRANFDAVLGTLARRGEVRRFRDGFLRVPGSDFDAVRVPSADPATSRRVAEVPPEEMDSAVRRLIVDAHAVTDADLLVAVARIFGWRRTGSDIAIAIEESIDRLVASGSVSRLNGHLQSVDG